MGLNWRIDKTDNESHRIWHTGGTFGFSSYVVFYLERKIGIVLLANESDGMTQNRLASIARQIFDRTESVMK